MAAYFLCRIVVVDPVTNIFVDAFIVGIVYFRKRGFRHAFPTALALLALADARGQLDDLQRLPFPSLLLTLDMPIEQIAQFVVVPVSLTLVNTGKSGLY